MKIEVRYFASLADAAGLSRESVELGGRTTVADLWSALVQRHPRLGGLAFRPLVACDMDYAGWDAKLDGVREVGFLPPVSGG